MSASKDNDLNTLLQSDGFERKIRVAGMKNDIPIIKQILERLKLNNKSIEQLLYDKIEDLYNELELETKEEKTVFAKLRALVRRDHIANKKSEIDFSKIELNSILYHEICQLFQNEIKEKSCAQCIDWFCIIENEGWDGKTLFKKSKTDVIKKMNLNDGQKENYEELLKKLGIGKNKVKAGGSKKLYVKGGATAVISQDGKVKTRNISINDKKQRPNSNADQESDSSSSDSGN